MAKALLSLLVLSAVFAAVLTLNCFNRNAVNTDSNGSSYTCSSSDTTCYSYSVGTTMYAGCGTCNTTAHPDCTTCTNNNCNKKHNTVTCYSAIGLESVSSGTEVTCVSGSCYQYSATVSGRTLYYSGCGTCLSSYSGCTYCSSSLCNSASSVGVSAKMAAAGVMLLALMKLF